ncbi:MAG: molybdopterin-guanine dinucleotide biosynthesis protein B [Candidatus Hermodarchaeota archaeon]
MRIFAISGYSGTGKTTLIVALIDGLGKRGHTVSTVKSSMEDSMPPENSDTWKHLKAGAEMSILQGPSSTTIRFKERISLSKTLQIYDSDFLLVEGMKGLAIPRFWCVGERALEDVPPPGTVAVVAWKESATTAKEVDVPLLLPDDVESLVKVVEREAIDVSDIVL